MSGDDGAMRCMMMRDVDDDDDVLVCARRRPGVCDGVCAIRRGVDDL